MSAPLGRLRLPWVDLPLFGLLLACAPVCALPDLPEQVGLGPGGVWNDEGNRQRLLDMLKAHAAELRAWASDAGVRLPSAESAGELREQVRDLPQEPQIQEQPGYGYQPGFQQPQQWQQQPWN